LVWRAWHSAGVRFGRYRLFLPEFQYETAIHFCHRKAREMVCRLRRRNSRRKYTGKTLSEVRRNLKDALTLVIETNKELVVRESGAEVVREEIVVNV
jgi:hypothetical protein